MCWWRSAIQGWESLSDEQELIFDEFRRSERSVACGYGGMGLGLAITRRLIELHGGEIGVRSTGIEETGSTFYFSLPVILETPIGVETGKHTRNIVLVLSETIVSTSAAPYSKGFRGGNNRCH